MQITSKVTSFTQVVKNIKSGLENDENLSLLQK
jgi:hypothetical protein